MKTRTIQYTYDVTIIIHWLVLRRPQISKEDKKALKDRKNYYDEDEATQVIEALLKTASKWRLYFLGAIIGGFRRGELIALDEDDCDFENRRLLYHTTPTQMWKEWCEKNGFRYVTLHGLRHTNATYLLGQGASIKEIQHRLRHSTSQVSRIPILTSLRNRAVRQLPTSMCLIPKSEFVPNVKNESQSL